MKNKVKRFSLNDYAMNNLKIAINYLGEIRYYVLFSFLVFFLISLFGYFFPIFFEKEIMLMIQELILKTEELKGFDLTRFIMANNIQSALFAIIFGFFFGLIPVGILVVNGYVLGFVANKTVAVEGISVLWRLVPHGIFEIPAIMISTSLGLKLGMFLFTYTGKNKSKEFFKWIKNSFRVFVLIVIPLLVIAGIIEGLLIAYFG